MIDFYKQATADLGRPLTNAETLNQIIAQSSIYTGGKTDESADIQALLAAIIKTQAKCNASYRTYPFNITAGKMQQILPSNPNRNALIVAISTINTTPVVGVLFDQGPLQASNVALEYQVRSIQLDSALQNILQFNVACSNEVTIVAIDGVNIEGVIFEGV